MPFDPYPHHFTYTRLATDDEDNGKFVLFGKLSNGAVFSSDRPHQTYNTPTEILMVEKECNTHLRYMRFLQEEYEKAEKRLITRVYKDAPLS